MSSDIGVCLNGHTMASDERECELCGAPMDHADPDSSVIEPDTVECPVGHVNTEDAETCSQCGLRIVLPAICSNGHLVRAGLFSCPVCGSTIWLEQSSLHDLEHGRSGSRPTLLSEPLSLVLDHCTVLGGSGVDLHVAEPCIAIFGSTELRLVGQTSMTSVVAGYGELSMLGLSGGEVTTGGGFIGGGFGLEGAVKGMAIAGVANWLTTRTSVNTLIQVLHPEFEVFVHHGRYTPDELRIRLSSAFHQLGSVTSSD